MVLICLNCRCRYILGFDSLSVGFSFGPFILPLQRPVCFLLAVDVNALDAEDEEPVLEGNISVPGTAGEPNGTG